MSDRKLLKDITFFERYAGSLLIEYRSSGRREGWILKRSSELVVAGVHPREADRLARSGWYAPRDPEPWELE